MVIFEIYLWFNKCLKGTIVNRARNFLDEGHFKLRRSLVKSKGKIILSLKIKEEMFQKFSLL